MVSCAIKQNSSLHNPQTVCKYLSKNLMIACFSCNVWLGCSVTKNIMVCFKYLKSTFTISNGWVFLSCFCLIDNNNLPLLLHFRITLFDAPLPAYGYIWVKQLCIPEIENIYLLVALIFTCHFSETYCIFRPVLVSWFINWYSTLASI